MKVDAEDGGNVTEGIGAGMEGIELARGLRVKLSFEMEKYLEEVGGCGEREDGGVLGYSVT